MTDGDEITVLLRESASGWLSGRDEVRRLRGDPALVRPFDAACWREMAELGWLALMLPEALGGSGLGLAEAGELAELFGRKLLAAPFVAAAVMPSRLIAACAASTPERAMELARELTAGGRVLTCAWTPSRQVALAGGAVSGSLDAVSAVVENGVILAMAATAEGESALVAIDAGEPTMRVQRTAAGAGATLSAVVFDRVPVLFGAALLSGQAAERAWRDALDAGRTAAAAQLLGCAAAVLEKTIAYVDQRRQFDRAIGSFQTVRHRCVDLHIETMLARAAIRHAARTARDDPADFSMAAAAAKARAGDAALRACRTAIQLHGAMGFTDEADIGLYMRNALHLSSWLGSPLSSRRHFLSEWRARETRHA